MKSLILGGVKSGKSGFAESLARDSGNEVTVIVTASARDAEMTERIRRHRKSRPSHWRTIEEPIALGNALSNLTYNAIPPTPGFAQTCIIIDCLTLWLTNLLLVDDPQIFKHEKQSFVRAIEEFDQQLIIVSNETNLGIVPMGELSRRFCDEAGLLHQHLGQHVDHVVLMVAGLSHTIKGKCE